jgi:hypothetical protein
MESAHGKWRMWRVAILSVALIGLLAGTALAANPASNTTTTGQELEVEIVLSLDPITAIWAGTPVAVSANATLGGDGNANVVYVLDVSGSMENSALNPFQDIVAPSGIDPNDDCNGDGLAGSALDAACFGLIALNQSLGGGSHIDVGMVAFGDGATTADMSPAAGVQDFISPPNTDGNGSAVPDVEEVIRSTDTENTAAAPAGIGEFTDRITMGFGGTTNYDAALEAMNNLFASKPGESNRAVFISDGMPFVFTETPGSPLDNVAPTTTVDTFAIGTFAGGACAAGEPLADIASATGGVCTEVADPSTLAAVLPVQSTNITSLALEVNGAPVGSVSGSEPLAMSHSTVDITSVLQTGMNVITATAIAADGTTATADVSIEVVDMTLEPAYAVHDLSVEDSHTVTATLLGSPSIIGGRTVTFQVTDQNPTGPSDRTTDAGGVANYTYTVPMELESLGLDTISATVVIDGVPGVRTVTNRWIDATPPTGACLEIYNPNGRNVPQAPGKGGQAQNPDGFYELTGEDEPFGSDGLEVFLVDDGSGTVFGPFEAGTTIKYTQANGTSPRIKAMAGNNGSGGQATSVDYHIWGNGDGSVLAIDLSGNESENDAACLVPRPPK